MVGGLVHEEEVGRHHQQPGERDPRALPAGEHANALLHLIAGEEEGTEHAPDPALGLGGNQPVDLLEDGPRRVEALGVVLREIPGDHVVPERHDPRVGLDLPRQQLEQRGLAGAVQSDHRDPVAPQYLRGQVPVDGRGSVGLRHPLQAGDLAPAARRLGKPESHGGALFAHLHDRFLLQQLDPALHLPSLRRLGAEPLDEGLHLGAPPRLLLRLRREALFLRGPKLEVALVVSRVGAQPLGLEREHAIDLPIEEFAIVRDQQQRFARATEEGVEPFERRHVEMIGRLVQEEQLRILQQQGRQRGAHLPASGQIGGEPRELRPRESEPTEDLLRPVPAVELLVVRKLLVQFRELAAQLDLFLLRRRLRQSRLHGGNAPLQPGAPRDAGEHPIDDRSGRQLRKLLWQMPPSGSIWPARIFSKVLLPLPFGPIRPARSWWPSAKLAPSRSTLGP